MNGTLTSNTSNDLTVTPTATVNTTGSTLSYDPNNTSSYSGSGTSFLNIGSAGTVTGTLRNITVGTDPTTLMKAFTFNGSSSYISFPPYNFGSQFTLCAWIKPTSKTSINGLFANTTANQAPNGFKVGWNSWKQNNRVCYFEGGNGIQGGAAATAVVVTYDTWQHFGCVFDQGNARVIFFINGTPVSISRISTIMGIGTNNAFNIGAFIGSSYFMKAVLGSIKFFNYTFNATDMLADFMNAKAAYGL